MTGYTISRMENGYLKCTAENKEIYVVYYPMGGSGFAISQVKKGQNWTEGVGEEFCFAGDSLEEAEAYIEERLEVGQ